VSAGVDRYTYDLLGRRIGRNRGRIATVYVWDGANIYQYVKNNSIKYIDSLGLVIDDRIGGGDFGGCSTDACIKTCGNSQNCKEKCLNVWLKFTTWYYEKHPDFSGLDNCPCKLKRCTRTKYLGHGEIVEETVFKSPSKKWTLINPIAYPWYLQKYHPGASYDLRSKGSPSQQCTYGSSGQLITHGIGAGTADRFNSNSAHGEHMKSDVEPADWAMFLDGNPNKWPSDDGPCFKKYIEKRPINNGNNCSNNP
jgi:hypothetical protein